MCLRVYLLKCVLLLCACVRAYSSDLSGRAAHLVDEHALKLFFSTMVTPRVTLTLLARAPNISASALSLNSFLLSWKSKL